MLLEHLHFYSILCFGRIWLEPEFKFLGFFWRLEFGLSFGVSSTFGLRTWVKWF